jgi:hypothetical protein
LRPAPDTLAAGTGHTLDARTIQDTLRGTHIPDWNDAHLLILALDGEPKIHLSADGRCRVLQCC